MKEALILCIIHIYDFFIDLWKLYQKKNGKKSKMNSRGAVKNTLTEYIWHMIIFHTTHTEKKKKNVRLWVVIIID